MPSPTRTPTVPTVPADRPRHGFVRLVKIAVDRVLLARYCKLWGWLQPGGIALRDLREEDIARLEAGDLTHPGGAPSCSPPPTRTTHRETEASDRGPENRYVVDEATGIGRLVEAPAIFVDYE